jgi:hypothetical protein
VIPNREGLFNAYPAEVGVDETGPNKLTTCIVRFRLYEELQPSGEWRDCADEKFEVTGYFYLEKKDGSLNAITIDSLKAALGWDGRDPFWLQETDLSQHAVQVKLAFEEYNGKTRLKVQYLNPYGSTGSGGVTKADAPTRKSITNRLGSKLRALAGPSQPTADKPATPPKLPPAKPKAPATPAPASAPALPSEPEPSAECSMEAAWDEFIKHCRGGKWDQEAVEKEWFRVLAELFPGKQPDELSPAEWAAMRDEGPARIIPF